MKSREEWVGDVPEPPASALPWRRVSEGLPAVNQEVLVVMFEEDHKEYFFFHAWFDQRGMWRLLDGTEQNYVSECMLTDPLWWLPFSDLPLPEGVEL